MRVRAAIWPGPVSSPGVAAAKVKALPARTPRTREMIAGVAHADADDVGVVAHALEEADEGDVVDERLGGGDDLDEVGIEGRDAGVDAVEVLGGVEVVIADDEGDAGLAELLQAGLLDGLSADSSSMSTRWKPASAALERISTSAAMEPANLPPLAARRQVAMAVAAVLSAKNCLNLGRASSGLSR